MGIKNIAKKKRGIILFSTILKEKNRIKSSVKYHTKHFCGHLASHGESIVVLATLHEAIEHVEVASLSMMAIFWLFLLIFTYIGK